MRDGGGYGNYWKQLKQLSSTDMLIDVFFIGMSSP